MQVVLRDESFENIPNVELNDKLIKLGLKVRELRISKSLSQTDLAFKIGKDQPSINRLKKEKSIRVFCILLKLRMD
jgi:hypothetical protein